MIIINEKTQEADFCGFPRAGTDTLTRIIPATPEGDPELRCMFEVTERGNSVYINMISQLSENEKEQFLYWAKEEYFNRRIEEINW
jgi:hypothetical protein